MKKNKENKSEVPLITIIRDVFFYVLFAAFSYYDLIFKLKHTNSWFDGTLIRNHNMLLNFDYTNNEQSRLLQFYIPEFFIRVFHFSIINAYILQRFLFIYLAFCVFYHYLKKWFNPWLSVSAVMLIAAVMPLSFVNDLQESSALIMFTFIGALWAIRENKMLLYSIILLFGSINNETMLFLPAVYLFYHFENFSSKSFWPIIKRTILYALPAILAVGIIRYINWDRPNGWGLAWFNNMNYITNRLGIPTFDFYNISFLIVLLLSALWMYGFSKLNCKEKFIKRTLIAIPLFILPHLVTGIISEYRQMMPLTFIIIPVIFYYFVSLYKSIRNRIPQ
jgi:hypothetical protein